MDVRCVKPLNFSPLACIKPFRMHESHKAPGARTAHRTMGPLSCSRDAGATPSCPTSGPSSFRNDATASLSSSPGSPCSSLGTPACVKASDVEGRPSQCVDVDELLKSLPPALQELCDFAVPDRCNFDTDAAWLSALEDARKKHAALAEAAGVTITEEDLELADRLLQCLLP